MAEHPGEKDGTGVCGLLALGDPWGALEDSGAEVKKAGDSRAAW